MQPPNRTVSCCCEDLSSHVPHRSAAHAVRTLLSSRDQRARVSRNATNTVACRALLCYHLSACSLVRVPTSPSAHLSACQLVQVLTRPRAIRPPSYMLCTLRVSSLRALITTGGCRTVVHTIRSGTHLHVQTINISSYPLAISISNLDIACFRVPSRFPVHPRKLQSLA
jgi:hypothetical protein